MDYCKCGHPLKKKHHVRCYKCQFIKKNGRDAEYLWGRRRIAIAFRHKLYRNKVKWRARMDYLVRNLKDDEMICDYQPGYPNGTINICSCPCTGDC
jgi:hypothetical protein